MDLRHRYNRQKGQSLIEILFAIAIFTIGVVTVGYLIIDARASLHYATDLTKARLLAAEGVEAMVSIQSGGFDLMPAGTYGLVVGDGKWSLASSSDTQGKFTRTVRVEDVDVDNKTITSAVTWNALGGRIKEVSYTTRLSNWMQVGGEAGDLEVYTSGAALFASSTELKGLSIKNNGGDTIVLTDMTIAWDTPSSLEKITVGGSDVFVSPSSTPTMSGQVIDVTDYQLPVSSGFHPIDVMLFDGSMAGTNFIVQFTLEDGSVRSVYFSPT